MKKSLVALAALAVAGVASAQSSVTLFGTVDASVSGVSNKSSNGTSTVRTSSTGLSGSNANSSAFGFRGVEDLGGGLAASFWLEGDGSTDTGAGGTLLFGRRSTVSLSGNFGEIRLGRDYKPTFWNYAAYSPFGTNGVGTALGYRAAALFEASGGAVRSSNSIGYFLPANLGGFYGQVQYAFHEQTKYDDATAQSTLNNNSRGGSYVGGRFGYANGPLDVSAAYGVQNVGSDFALGLDSLVKTFNAGATYDFGPLKLFAQYDHVKSDDGFYSIYGTTAVSGADVTANAYLLGVTVPVGAGVIRASYGHVKFDLPTASWYGYTEPKADQLALGYVHNLSKRTSLYATVSYLKNKDGSPLVLSGSYYGLTSGYTAKSSLGYDFGISHKF
ncbi:MAG: porin [Xenophilus sp.]